MFQLNNGIPNHVSTVLLNCLCHFSFPINSPMRTIARLSKIILQHNAVLEGAAQENVCQTDKCSTDNDDKNSYVQTVRKTISGKPISSIFISIKRHQIINLLSLPPLRAHMQMDAWQDACTGFFIGGIKVCLFASCCSPFIPARQSSKAENKHNLLILKCWGRINSSVDNNRIWQADFLHTAARANWL